MIRNISNLKWRYIDNLGASIKHARDGLDLSDEAGRIVRSLNEDGIAISSVEQLFEGDTRLFEDLQTLVTQVMRERAGEIDERRKISSEGIKSFIVNVLGDRPVLDPCEPGARLAVSPQILGIANAYMEMLTHLRFFNVWHTLISESEPRSSQLWHRDPEDRRIVKVFIYLSDVDEGAGPLTYAPSTHPKGMIRQLPETLPDPKLGFRRSSDDQMRRVVPEDRWVKAVGPVGSIVFADTRGFHKGGWARTRERTMFTCMFTSPRSRAREHFERIPVSMADLDLTQKFALSL